MTDASISSHASHISSRAHILDIAYTFLILILTLISSSRLHLRAPAPHPVLHGLPPDTPHCTHTHTRAPPLVVATVHRYSQQTLGSLYHQHLVYASLTWTTLSHCSHPARVFHDLHVHESRFCFAASQIVMVFASQSASVRFPDTVTSPVRFIRKDFCPARAFEQSTSHRTVIPPSILLQPDIVMIEISSIPSVVVSARSNV